MKILFVEDDPEIAYRTKQSIADAHHTVDIVSRKDEVMYLLSTAHYDCLLLDLILKDENGLAICKEVRDRSLDIPILIYSILDDPYSKVLVLEAGADDMVSKSASYQELVARIHALSRRQIKPIAQTSSTYQNLFLDQKNKTVYLHDQLLELSPKEFQLLELLIQSPEKTCSRNEIIEHVWDMYVDPFTNKVDVYMNFLRKKLKAYCLADEKYLQTVRGFGYRLAGK